jgi:ribose transport system substrate-binding protein
MDGLFCPNESTTFGALQVIRESGLAGKIAFVGFDSSPKLIEAMRRATIHGLILQDPLRMGQLGVETLVKHLRGETVAKRIDTGVYAVTPENMEEPRMQELLSPPYQTWLDREAGLPSGGEGVLTVAVIPKGTTHEFWKTIHAGAVKGALAAGNVHIIWKGPLKEDDREEQIKVVDNFIARKVDGIVLAPLDDKALVEPVNRAMASDIPVAIIDSGLSGDNYVSFVATDNYQGGRLAGQRLADVMKGWNKGAAEGD